LFDLTGKEEDAKIFLREFPLTKIITIWPSEKHVKKEKGEVPRRELYSISK